MAVHPGILGCGRDGDGEDVPVFVDNTGEVTGTDSVTAVLETGSKTIKLLYGRTVGGMNVPIAVSSTGHLLFV